MELHGLQGWRPLNGRPRLRMAGWCRSVCGRRLSLRPIGCTPALSVTAAAAVSSFWHYTSVICLCLLSLADDCFPVSDVHWRRLRSSETRTLVVSRTWNNFDTAFSRAGPRIWNYLLTSLENKQITYLFMASEMTAHHRWCSMHHP